jgi:hypothetical protein
MGLSRYYSVLLLLALVVWNLNVAAQETLGEECYRCDFKQYRARAEALGLEVLPLGRVYLIDRYHDRLKKYLLSSEPSSEGVNSKAVTMNTHKALPSTLSDDWAVTSDEVIDYFSVERGSLRIDFWELRPSADEMKLFENFDTLAEDILNIHDPALHAAKSTGAEAQ